MQILNGLNPSQQEAVTHGEGPLLILAGAGSGKTRVLTTRIAFLLSERGIKPSEVFAVTFTNKAANEMRSRIGSLIGTRAEGMWLGTFHSLGLRILRVEGKAIALPPSLTVYDSDDQLRLVKEVMEDLSIGTKALQPKAVLSRIDEAKNDGIMPEEYLKYATDYFSERVSSVYSSYQKRLRKMGALDFGDLICLPVFLFRENPHILERYQEYFTHVLVDEYQDTNRSQYALMNALSARKRNLCAVGDPDQSIYAWRGADIRNIMEFERDWSDATILRLEQNYRSTQSILNAANAVISNNRNRYEKSLWTENAAGSLPVYEECSDDKEEAEHAVSLMRQALKSGEAHGYGNIALFYRTNAQSRVLEERLIREHIPYAIVGGTKFYERMEVKDSLAYLKVVSNPLDAISLKRIINVPARGVGEATLDSASEQAEAGGISLYEAVTKGLNSGSLRKPELAKLFASFEKAIAEKTTVPLHELALTLLERAGYMEMYEKEATEESYGRLENIHELISAIKDYEESTNTPSLEDFLEKVALVNDVDSYETGAERVTLMTVHSAKGLEFDTVIIVGMEEKLFPHQRSTDSFDGVEEERRLCYVAMTRARKRLYMLSARTRSLYGELRFQTQSRFLEEIPSKLIERRGKQNDTPATGLRYTYDDSQLPPPESEKVFRLDAPEEGNSISQDPWRIGMRVNHPDFGPGVILSKDGSGDNTKLTVSFKNSGKKKLVAKYAPLTPYA